MFPNTNTKRWLWLFGGVGILLMGMLLFLPTKTPPSSPLQIESIPQEMEKASHRIIQDPPRFYPSLPAPAGESLQAEGNAPILEQ